MNIPFTSIVLTTSALVSSNPVEVRGIYVCAQSAGKGCSVYDGRDASSGIERGHFEAAANVTMPAIFPPGFRFDRGLYVTVESGVDHITVVYRVLPFTPQLEPVI